MSCGASRRWPSRARSRRAPSCSARATTSSTCYIVRRGRARAIREHPDGRQITLATFGPGEIFGELAMFDDERALGDGRGDSTTSWRSRSSASDMRRLMHEHAEIAVKLAIALGAPPARRERAARAPVLPDRPEPRGGRARPARRGGARRGRRPGDVRITATQADLAKLAGSSRESASRFLAVLERAGVISQGRGRLIVHDPDALGGYVY